MMSYGIDASQRKAAKVVGISYLFAMVTAVFVFELAMGLWLLIKGLRPSVV